MNKSIQKLGFMPATLQTKSAEDDQVKAIAEKINLKVSEMKEKQSELETRLNQFEKKANRPGVPGTSTKASKSLASDALSKYIRKGDASALDELDTKAMATSSDTDGGYAVPDIIAQELEKLEYQSSAIMRLATVVESETGTYKKLVNLRGTGAGWVGETDARPNTGTPKLASVDIKLGELYANPQATQQMIDDAAFNVDQFITEEVGEKFSDQLGEALISGDGTNKPKGILTYASTAEKDNVREFGTLQFVETAAAALITFDDVKALRSSLNAKYRTGAAFVMNDTTALILSLIKDGNDRYMWQEAVSAGEPATLFGYPVEIDENMPDIAAGSVPVMFGNLLRGYHIPRRFDIRMLRDPYTSKPYVNFYTTQRIGGGVVNSECIKLLKIKSA
ncbi:phage major capsid protein [Rheinheimera sp. UJ51]|uniref:phage major capsid protein n=1 Tax=Rheinheimera sp. UJ51 TaxID=2892446 RepID=UPI001E37CFBD|nr:phage major capsid protein [Rheinheimera sp. UJ51]MCC5451684.1 phage major capsid protein [Rheinheimera sp. UJ51]